MYFNSFAEFIDMGGRGFYIWLSYGSVFVALSVYYIYSKRKTQNTQQELIKFYKRMDSRSQMANQNEDV